MILTRYERGVKFLDLDMFRHKSLDEDGCSIYNECWSCVIYENGNSPDQHNVVKFANKDLALMFIIQNGWKEQTTL